MNLQLLPAHLRDDVPAWRKPVVVFLAARERRLGSRRTVEGYARIIWPFLTRMESPVTVGATIASRPPLSLDQAKEIVSRPRYGRSTSGTVTEPSGR